MGEVPERVMTIDPSTMPIPAKRTCSVDNCWELVIDLPQLESAKDMDLEVHDDGTLTLSAKGYAELSLEMPANADADALSCKFDKSTRALRLSAPLAAQHEDTQSCKSIGVPSIDFLNSLAGIPPLQRSCSSANSESQDGVDANPVLGNSVVEGKAENCARVPTEVEVTAKVEEEAEARAFIREREKAQAEAEKKIKASTEAEPIIDSKVMQKEKRTQVVSRRLPDPNGDGMLIEELVEEQVNFSNTACITKTKEKKKNRGKGNRAMGGFLL